jgi:putative membrane protein
MRFLLPLPWAVGSGVLFWLLHGGRIGLFVSPKSFPLLYASAWILLIVAILRIWQAFRGGLCLKRPRPLELTWMLPFLALPFAGNLSAGNAVSRGLSAVSGTSPSLQNAPGGSPADASPREEGDSLPDIPPPSARIPELPAIEPAEVKEWRQEDFDTIADTEFALKVSRIWRRPGKFSGKIVVLTGFVSSDATFGPGGFFLTRLLMVCCAADCMPVGFYCLPGKVQLSEGQWVSLAGRIGVSMAKLPGWDSPRPVPVLTVLEARPVDPPRVPYIYPMGQ